jgi:hypothetical protein
VGNNDLFSLLLTNLSPSRHQASATTRILVVYLHLNSNYNSPPDVTKMQDNGQAWNRWSPHQKAFHTETKEESGVQSTITSINADELAANPEGYNQIFHSQLSCSFGCLNCAVFGFNNQFHHHLLQEHGASDTLTSQLHKKTFCHTPYESQHPPPSPPSLSLSMPLNVCSSSFAFHIDVTAPPRTYLTHYDRQFWRILLLFGFGFSLFVRTMSEPVFKARQVGVECTRLLH